MDDANKFNEYTDRANVEANNQIDFQVVNGDYDELNEIEEISFSKKHMDYVQKEEERRKMQLEQDVREILEEKPNQIVRIDEEE